MKQLALIALSLLHLASAQSRKYTLLITNANVVDVAAGKIIPHQLLAISNDTVKAVDDTKFAAKYKAEKQYDAHGQYVMPGLWDMHIHLRGGDSTIEANKALLPLFLAYGVTTVRECGGDITPSVLEWRKQTGRNLPDKEVLLGEMISRELAVQKARALGLEKDPEMAHL